MIKSQETKESILKTALALFKKKGFQKTSMRDIAAAAGVALGATYYYFRTKEELVFALYRRWQTESEEAARAVLSESTSFEERFRALTLLKLEQLKPFRKFLHVLAANALDPSHPVSPFGKSTSDVRDRAIAVMEEAMKGSDLIVPDTLKAQMPRLLWLVQMGVLYFWLNDESKNQEKTTRLLDLTLSMVIPLLGMTSMPFMTEANEQLVSLFSLFDSTKKGKT